MLPFKPGPFTNHTIELLILKSDLTFNITKIGQGRRSKELRNCVIAYALTKQYIWVWILELSPAYGCWRPTIKCMIPSACHYLF